MSQYPFIQLSGTGTGDSNPALDGRPFASLLDNDMAYGLYGTSFLSYRYDTTSILTESIPNVVVPNDNSSGTGAWLLVSIIGATGYFLGNVGIGVSSPSVRLAVSEDNDGGDVAVRVTNSAGSGSTDETVTLQLYHHTQGGVKITCGREGDYSTGANQDAYLTLNTLLNGSDNETLRCSAAGNVGVGVIPEAWDSGRTALQIGGNGSVFGDTAAGADKSLNVAQNAYLDSGGWKYISTDEASFFNQASGDHTFYVAASGTADSAISWITALKIDNNGNVGLRTSTPLALFHLVGSDVTMRLEDTDANGYALISTTGTSDIQIKADDSNVDTNSKITFSVDGSEKMRIDDDGNVGIEVTPEVWDSVLTALQLGGNASLNATTALGAAGSFSVSQNAYDDGSWKYKSTDEASSYKQQSGEHVFRVAASGTAGTAVSWTEAMRIDVNGIVSIPQVYSHDMNGETYRDLLINNSGELGYDSSTERKKTNIVDLEETNIDKYRVVEFEYKKKDDQGNYIDEGTGIKEHGMIAEEAELVDKRVVFYDDNGLPEGIHYKKIIPDLIKEIQNLKAEIALLKAK
jgi:hypothetical protein